MDQVTASVHTWFEGDVCIIITDYQSTCGCRWKVDMWGNVRRIEVCKRDLLSPSPWEQQTTLALDA